MKNVLLILVFIVSSIAFAMDKIRTADVGFQGAGYHLAIELLFEDGQDSYRFSLRDNTNNLSTEVSDCTYSQDHLDSQISQIADASVKADFNWIFFKSGNSSTSIEVFFPEFQKLLERARADCKTKALQQLQDELMSRAG